MGRARQGGSLRVRHNPQPNGWYRFLGLAKIAAEFEVSEQTIYTWRRQARIDAGLATSEQAELAAAKRRIRELEPERAVHRRATELLKEKSDPKGRTRRSK